ncbi:hypothetical protein GHT06_014642 [Daphnia sinensis]|uniref:Alpha 1,4-glycosyltransferase domain-containing protein n=1 Tax=Daphnia sinensis TaxID=1820382 RepID=A0AAD5L835_9CRUS|nr:hypothetical protein GHT06_014642 [Daphnia sinensis]
MSWNRRFIFLAVVFTLLVVISVAYISSDYYLSQMSPRVNIPNRVFSRCCHGPTDQLDLCGRPDCIWPCPISIDNQQLNITTGDKAFVIETSGATSLDFRQACSVESLAYRNPNLTVYLLMTDDYVESASMSALTQNYPNLHVKAIDLTHFMMGTPLESWYLCTEWNRGWYAVAHLSDALRLLTVSKYGGYYFDLDVIHLRPVSAYRNFAVAEDDYLVANGIIHADYQHPVIQTALEQFSIEYRWYIWAHNGPALLTRILRKLCNIYDIRLMAPSRCHGFQVLPTSSFFPIDVHSPKKYFRNQLAKDEFQWDESVVAAHVYNKLTAHMTIYKNSNQLYVQLARSSCPRVFDAAPNQF